MSDIFGTLQYGSLALVVFLGVAIGLCSVVHERVMSALERVAPDQRADLLTLWAALPLTLALVVTLATFSPSLLTQLGWVADHCLNHRASHPHLCLLHPQGMLGDTLLWLAPGLLLALVSAIAATLWRQGVNSRGQTRALLRHASYDAKLKAHVLKTAQPVALCAGLILPRVVVSCGLAALLEPEQYRAVIAHEQAHARRRDALRLLLVRCLCLLQVPSIGRDLVRHLLLACEQACDEDAARMTGDRLGVADAIVKVARYAANRPGPALAFGVHPVVTRVESLLEPKVTAVVPRQFLVIGASALLLIPLLLGQPMHHLTESLLGFLTR